MNIFDRDRIGQSVYCRVVWGTEVTPKSPANYGYVKWSHARRGQVVKSIEIIGQGHVKGPWIVELVDVPFVNWVYGQV